MFMIVDDGTHQLEWISIGVALGVVSVLLVVTILVMGYNLYRLYRLQEEDKEEEAVGVVVGQDPMLVRAIK